MISYGLMELLLLTGCTTSPGSNSTKIVPTTLSSRPLIRRVVGMVLYNNKLKRRILAGLGLLIVQVKERLPTSRGLLLSPKLRSCHPF